MNLDVLDHALSFALWITLKASVLLAIAGIIQAVTHCRTSAAMRHLVWTLALASVLLLPIAALALPGWAVTGRAVREPALHETPAATLDDRAFASAMLPERAEPGPVVRSQDSGWWIALAGVYATGVLVMLVQFAFDRRNLKRLAREGIEMRDREWTRLLGECAARLRIRRPVRLLRSRERTMPMAFGTRHPTIVVPAIADTWVEDRRRAVVLHELAHVARFDCFTQTLAFAACAMYWFHPAVWWAARRLRVERELACDDRVIATAGRAREYADHLLEIAYAFGGDRAPALAVSMARPRQLEGRMLAALDTTRNRNVPASPVRVAGAVIAATLLLPVASATSAVVTADPEETLTRGADSLPSGGRHEGHRGAAAGAAAASPSGSPSAAWLARNTGSVGDTGAQDAQDGGTWEIRRTGTEGTVHLRLTERDSSSGTNVAVDQLTGLTASQLAGAGGPVQFRLRRDAGTFTFDGVLRNGLGAGTFSFTADPQFPAELVKRGFTRPTPLEQYQMARHDVGYAFVDELNAQGYAKPQTSELVRAGQHGVQAAYVRDLGALGYRLGTLAPLIELRDHGVTPAYIRELAELGYKGLPVDDLRTARDHGVTPEFVKEMRDAGYGSLPMPQLINARDHGVSAAFASELAAVGYAKLPLDALIRTRDHGVSAEYAREMRALGHTVTLDELVSARDHGVSVEFAREMGALGFGNLSLEKLVRLRDHGVTPKYAQELKALGYDRIAIEDLVTLRDHGVSTESIRTANARAGTRLPIDMLKSLAAGGMR